MPPLDVSMRERSVDDPSKARVGGDRSSSRAIFQAQGRNIARCMLPAGRDKTAMPTLCPLPS